MIRRTLALVVFLAGCSSSVTPIPPTTIRSGESSLRDLPAGRYSVAWTAAGCTFLDLRYAPTSGAAEVVIRSTSDGSAGLPTGSATVDLPAGPAYVNGAADCDYVVTLAAA